MHPGESPRQHRNYMHATALETARIAIQDLLGGSLDSVLAQTSPPEEQYNLSPVPDEKLGSFIESYAPDLFMISETPDSVSLPAYLMELRGDSQRIARAKEHRAGTAELYPLPPSYTQQNRQSLLGYAKQQVDQYPSSKLFRADEAAKTMLTSYLARQFETPLREKYEAFRRKREQIYYNLLDVPYGHSIDVQQYAIEHDIEPTRLRQTAQKIEAIRIPSYVLASPLELPEDNRNAIVESLLAEGLETIKLSQEIGYREDGSQRLPIETALKLVELVPLEDVRSLLQRHPEAASALYERLTSYLNSTPGYNTQEIIDAVDPDEIARHEDIRSRAAIAQIREHSKLRAEKSAKLYTELAPSLEATAQILDTVNVPVSVTEQDRNILSPSENVKKLVEENLKNIAREVARRKLQTEDTDEVPDIADLWYNWPKKRLENAGKQLISGFNGNARNLTFMRLTTTDEAIREYRANLGEGLDEIDDNTFQLICVAVELKSSGKPAQVSTVRFAIYCCETPTGPRMICSPVRQTQAERAQDGIKAAAMRTGHELQAQRMQKPFSGGLPGTGKRN